MGRDNEFNEPYLPARYREKIREKQQRRRAKKILAFAIIIAIIAAVVYFVAGFLGTGISEASLSRTMPAVPAVTIIPPAAVATTSLPDITSPAPGTGSTHAPSAGYTIDPGVPITASGGALPLDGAAAALREYYPADDYSIKSVNYSAGQTHNLFGFTIRPVSSTAGTLDLVVFIDATTGIPYAAGQETAAVPMETAKQIATGAFPEVSANTVRLWYSESPDKGNVWMFILASGNMTLVTGSVDATSGELVAFTRTIPQSGRPSETGILQEKAESIASHYISDKNGGTLPLNRTIARYEVWGTPSVPAAGQYVFAWERRFLDYPVDTDGIEVAVDSVTGDVIGYDKRWTTPDYAFSQTLEQAIAQRDATFAVMQEAKGVFPESVGSVRILSAEMRWNNGHDTGTSQRPGSVPLAWKVVFDDAAIRADNSLPPGIGWVAIQTGNVTALEYRH